MLVILYVACLLINVLYIKRRKSSKILAIISAVLIVIIMGGNNSNPDYEGYKYFYDNSFYPDSFEFGYVALLKTGLSLGLQYNSFLIILDFICILLLAWFISKHTEQYHFVIVMYLLFMIFLDTIQIRNFIMTVLFCIAFEALLKNKKPLFVLILILSCTIHFSTIPLFIFYFIKPRKQKNAVYPKLIFAAVIIVSLLTFVNNNTVPFVNYISQSLLSGREDKSIYFLTHTKLGFISTFIVYFYNLFLVYISRRYIIENRSYIEETDLKFVDTTYQVLLLSSFALPLSMMNSNFSRYIRIDNIFIYITFAITLSLYFKSTTNRQITCGVNIFGRYCSKSVYIMLITGNLLMWILLKGVPQEMIEILENNFFIS